MNHSQNKEKDSAALSKTISDFDKSQKSFASQLRVMDGGDDPVLLADVGGVGSSSSVPSRRRSRSRPKGSAGGSKGSIEHADKTSISGGGLNAASDHMKIFMENMERMMIMQGRMVEQAIAAASQAAGAAASLVQAQALTGRDVAAVAAAAAVIPTQVAPAVPTAPLAPQVVVAGKPAKLPECISEAMMKSLSHYEKDLRKHIRNEMRIEKSKAIVDVFLGDTSRSVYPVGVRPFSSVEEQKELDSVLTAASTSDYELRIKLQCGITRREAMQVVHWECQKFLRATDLESLYEHRANLSKLITRASYDANCCNAVKEAWQQSVAGVDGLDPPKSNLDMTAVTTKMESDYAALIAKIAREKKERDDKTKSEAKVREERDKAVAASDPKLLLEKCVVKVIGKHLQANGGDEDGMDEDLGPQDDSFADDVHHLVKAIKGQSPSTKNVQSPGDGGGKGVKPKAKAKGKAKAKSKQEKQKKQQNTEGGKGKGKVNQDNQSHEHYQNSKSKSKGKGRGFQANGKRQNHMFSKGKSKGKGKGKSKGKGKGKGKGSWGWNWVPRVFDFRGGWRGR